MKRRQPARKPSKRPRKRSRQVTISPPSAGLEIGALPPSVNNAPPPTLEIVEPLKPTAGTAPGEIKWLNDQAQPVTFINDKGEPVIWTTDATLKPEGELKADAGLISPARHEKMLSQLAVLERLMAELREQPPGIGHNQPPISEEEVREITTAIVILKAQPIVPTAPNEARAAASTLKKVGERLGTYLDDFLSEASKSAGKAFGKRLVDISYWSALATTLMVLAHTVADWLH